MNTLCGAAIGVHAAGALFHVLLFRENVRNTHSTFFEGVWNMVMTFANAGAAGAYLASFA